MNDSSSSPAVVHTLELTELASGSDSAPSLAPAAGSSNPLHQIKATLRVCIGESTITVGELMRAREHQVIRLDRTLSEPVDVMLEGKIVARGELVAVDDQFAVRITELPVPLKP
jgi:flagellar motor switch protein FliN/FliY